MAKEPIESKSEFRRLANDPHPIEVRRALKAWAANKPPEVRNLATTVCQLMWMSERYPHSNALRSVLAANLTRLETATAP
jgi:hypothetical protein